MKNIGRILLIIFAILAFIGLIWVAVTPNAAGSEIDFADWMGKPLTSYMIYVSLITLAITFVAFLIYKVVDLIKYPEHLKEALWTFGSIVIAVIIGFIFSNDETIVQGSQSAEGMVSKLIGTGIIASGILLVVALAFLFWDTIKGIIKS